MSIRFRQFKEPWVKVPATLLPELFRLSTRKISNSVDTRPPCWGAASMCHKFARSMFGSGYITFDLYGPAFCYVRRMHLAVLFLISIAYTMTTMLYECVVFIISDRK